MTYSSIRSAETTSSLTPATSPAEHGLHVVTKGGIRSIGTQSVLYAAGSS